MVRLLRAACGAFWVAASIFVSPLAFAQESDLQQIVKRGVVKVGAPLSDPWYINEPGSNKWTGLVPETYEVLFGSINVKVEYVPTEWGTAVAGLQAGRFDIMGAFDPTPQRTLVIDFTRPLGYVDTAVLTVKGDAAKYRTWADIDKAKLRIAGVDGTSYVITMRPKLPNVQWVLAPSYEAAMLEVQSGRADLMLASSFTFAKLIKENLKGNGEYVVPEPKNRIPTNIGLRKSNPPELREWLNHALNWFEQRGELDKIWEKYSKVGR